MRFNILGGFLVLAMIALARDAAALLPQPDTFYRSNGYAVILMLLLPVGWPFVASRGRSGGGAARQTAV